MTQDEQGSGLVQPSGFVRLDEAVEDAEFGRALHEMVVGRLAGNGDAEATHGAGPGREPLDYERNTFAIRVPAFLLPGYVPTAEDEARMAKFTAERDSLQPVYVLAIRALDAIRDPAGRVVLDLHRRTVPVYGAGHWECSGCDEGAHAVDRAEWPCSTVLALCEHYGIRLDEQAVHMLVRPEDGSLDAGEGS